MRRDTAFLVLLSSILLLLLQGCAIPTRLDAVPAQDTSRAVIPHIPNARFWVDTDLEPFVREAQIALAREQASRAAAGNTGTLPPANFLAISGGGDHGAFGAGLLVGWTRQGTRPEFNVVTGVSTGALIAPFAFLGPAYDDELQAVYTTVAPRDIFIRRNILAALINDGMADNQPLWTLMSKHINEDMLAKIAQEYRKGRLLLVGTANLDVRRPVIWNMGAIAEAAAVYPQALDLFRYVLIASASIPGAFPPVMIDVELDGKPYQEMHVDGGAITQVFIYPVGLGSAIRDQVQKIVPRERNLYIIRNARLDPDWASVERRTITIAGRAIASLIHTQGIGDLFRLYLQAKQDGLNYHLAYIGADFTTPHQQSFDTEFMQALFDYGYRMALPGYPWRTTPPGPPATPPQ